MDNKWRGAPVVNKWLSYNTYNDMVFYNFLFHLSTFSKVDPPNPCAHTRNDLRLGIINWICFTIWNRCLNITCIFNDNSCYVGIYVWQKCPVPANRLHSILDSCRNKSIFCDAGRFSIIFCCDIWNFVDLDGIKPNLTT